MNDKKKVRLSLRLNRELYDMLCDISPLFSNMTECMEYILKEFQNSEKHLAMLEKLQNTRELMIRLEQKFNSQRV